MPRLVPMPLWSRCPIGQAMLVALLAVTVAVPCQGADAALVRELRDLSSVLPDAQVRIDRATGVATNVSRRDGFLSGPEAGVKALAADVDAPVKRFLDRYPSLFGGGSAALAGAAVVRDDRDGANGMRTVHWQQRVDGIPVFGALLSANLTSRGELMRIGSRFVPDLDAVAAKVAHARLAAAPPLAVGDALAAVAAELEPGLAISEVAVLSAVGDAARHHRLSAVGLHGDAYASLAWFPRAAGLRLAWDVIASGRGGRVEVLIDAQDASVLLSRSLTATDCFAQLAGAAPAAAAAAAPAAAPAPADGSAGLAATIRLNVFASDSPAPLSPGWSSSSTAQAAIVSRTMLQLASIDATASPNGWIDAANETTGNNVDAHSDTNADNQADLPRPNGSGSPVTFDFPLDLTADPSTYRNAAITNLFYWCNFCHDRLYGLGFSESAGNFQNDTFGRGGSGNDAVQADAQDGSGVNNANFSWATDGTPGRMQMFLWSSPSPRRDGDLDATVIIHEYCHGLSNRLIGGGVGISQLQPAGMGEGWSDFYALALLSDPADDVQGTYAVGSYIANGLVADNYYRGIRRYPYAIEPGPSVTSGSRNPLTLSDIIANTEVHKQGEVWCMALWEARGQLIGKLGGAVGNQTMLRLVTDGLKLSPPDPTFLEARDAILQADLASNGGANLKQLWIGFAKRGMGMSATVPDSSTTTGVVQAFDVPGDLLVTSAKGFASGGAPGGPFAPTQASYTLRNISESNLSWSATRTASWIGLSSAGGTLAPHATTTVTVSLTAAAAALPIGDYHDAVTFTNTTSSSGTTSRAVDLDVANNYTMGPVGYSWIDASGHTPVDLGAGTASDDAASAALALPFPFRFYGKSFSTVSVGSNGLLGFAPAGLNQWENTDLPDSTLPNAIIAPWWDDLYPPQPGARVTVGLAGSGSSRAFVITWTNVPSVNALSQGFTFQALLMEGSNDIIFQYQEVRSGLATYGAGRSATIGIESTSGTIARTFSYNGSALVANGQAILFHLPIPSAATPTISPGAGSYVAPLTITITSTPGAAIRYTIDGSTPSPSNGTVYSGPFVLAANATVRAFASGTDFTDSGVASAAYVLTTAPPSTSTPSSVADDANGRSGGSCGVGTGLGVLLIALTVALRAAFTRPRASAER